MASHRWMGWSRVEVAKTHVASSEVEVKNWTHQLRYINVRMVVLVITINSLMKVTWWRHVWVPTVIVHGLRFIHYEVGTIGIYDKKETRLKIDRYCYKEEIYYIKGVVEWSWSKGHIKPWSAKQATGSSQHLLNASWGLRPQVENQN